MKRIFGVLLAIGMLFLCSPSATSFEPAKKPAERSAGGYAVVSWYGKPFHGRYMASGIRYNMYNPRIVAHKTLPLGTMIRIQNLKNKRSIVVWVLDRGPYIRGRAFDLSYAAARELGLVGIGVAKVRYEILRGDARI